MIEPRILEVRTRILKKNDEVAREMRVRFLRAGVLVINMVSSPGTGRTAFLKETLARLVARGVACAAVVGNLETDNDARRLAESGAPVRQIMTHRPGMKIFETSAKTGVGIDGWLAFLADRRRVIAGE